MSDATPREDVSRKTVVLQLPGMNSVTVRKAVEYGQTDSTPLTMDLYHPLESADVARPPVVLVVAGYPGAGVERVFGCQSKDMGSSVSWGRLLAASGLVGVTYSNREPLGDVQKVLSYLHGDRDALGIDATRIGLLARSGNVPLALSILMQRGQTTLKCAALLYGYMLDSEESTVVADGARQWGFVNPCHGKSIDDFPDDVPLLIARAGRDQFPNLNDTIDRFVSGALRRNLPLTLVNHARGPHAFDLFDDSDSSRGIIKHVLTFLASHLTR